MRYLVPALAWSLYRAAAKVARMTPVERHNAAIPPKVREALSATA